MTEVTRVRGEFFHLFDFTLDKFDPWERVLSPLSVNSSSDISGLPASLVVLELC
jgi:hypothetical protein